jgi:hypothetical protein
MLVLRADHGITDRSNREKCDGHGRCLVGPGRVTAGFAYPGRALRADYARASAGLLFAAAVIFLPLHWGLALGFGAIAVLLLGFGLRTALRQMSRVELSETAIAVTGPLPRRIVWAELTAFRLRYFALRKDRRLGWMELTLRGKGSDRLSIESQIDGFAAIVERAAQAAAGLEVDEATLINLAALGLAMPKRRQRQPR